MQVGTVDMTIYSYGLGYELSQELMDDDLYGVVGKPSSQYLAVSGRDTEERVTWGLLNGAFTTTLSYDGVSIINATHPLKGGGTYANRPVAAQALGFTSLQASIERFRLMVNERGLKIRTAPNKLVIPVGLSWLADEILGSEYKPHTSDNTINVMSSNRLGITTVVSEYLTSATAWFMIGEKHKLMVFWRKRPMFDGEYIKRSRVGQFYSYFRFGTAAFDWRYIDGSP